MDQTSTFKPLPEFSFVQTFPGNEFNNFLEQKEPPAKEEHGGEQQQLLYPQLPQQLSEPPEVVPQQQREDHPPQQGRGFVDESGENRYTGFKIYDAVPAF